MEKKHTVKAKINVVDLSKKGSAIELDIYVGEKLGTLKIGHGSMEWIGKHGGKDKRKKITWSQFAEKIYDL